MSSDTFLPLLPYASSIACTGHFAAQFDADEMTTEEMEELDELLDEY